MIMAPIVDSRPRATTAPTMRDALSPKRCRAAISATSNFPAISDVGAASRNTQFSQTYRQVTTSVPMMTARGSVLAGSLTSPATYEAAFQPL